MRFRRKCKSFLLMLFSTPLMMGGCGCDRDHKTPPQSTAPSAGQEPTVEKAKEPLIKKAEVTDWCVEHGVPESICTRCNATLIDGFKKKGDWCKEHDLPESQCIKCHPELEAKFKAMAPPSTAAQADKPKEPLFRKPEVKDWCVEHGVPESICTRCNATLIEGFKKKGDWCMEHDLPESQCFVCHPELKAKFEAMKPKAP